MFGRLIGLVSLSALAALAMAGPQTFSQRVQNIRAGVVILATAKSSLPNAQPLSAGPYALYNLDSNTSIKPAGWNFYNPYAPTRVTPAIYSRWSAIDPNNTQGIGTRISKRNAAYWEVFLSQITDQELGNYDMLLVNPAFLASLNPAEQQRLRRFVDNGGLLWIDPSSLSNGVDPFNNFPLPFSVISSTGGQQTDFSNTLMNGLQTLTPGDINVIDSYGPSTFVLAPVTLPNSLTAIAGGSSTDFHRLIPVSYVGGSPTISIGRIGEGVIVVTSRGPSIELNRSQENSSLTANTGFAAFDPILGQDGLAAAKLAINMVSLLRESRQQASGSRKDSSSAVDINPPLLSRSSVADPNYSQNLTGIGNSQATPALYKGLLVTTVNGYVKVYDANPIVDLDGDGNPDDGIQDYSYGAPYDEIWQSQQLQGPLSAPVCAEVPGSAPGYPTDEVLVLDRFGTLHIFNLMPRNADGTLSGIANEATPIGPPNGAPTQDGSLTGVPMAPTVHEGIAYIADTYNKLGVNSGRVWQVDLQAGTYVQDGGNAFVMGGNTSSFVPSLPEFSYGPTVGYIPIQDNSGGVDKVLYAPFAANVNQNVPSCGFTSLWLGARGEAATYTVNTNILEVTTRAGSHGSLPIYLGPPSSSSLGMQSLAPKIALLDASGNPYPATLMAGYFTGAVTNGQNGELDFGLTGAGVALFSQTPSVVSGVRVDYTIDWANSPTVQLTAVERGRLNMPDIQLGPVRVINGGVALSPQGTAYVVSSTAPSVSTSQSPPSGGGLYGFRELGVGVFTCISRYELYGPNTVVLNQTENVLDNVGVLGDNDDLTRAFPQFSSILQQPMSHYEIRGGPSIRNGQVFVTASAIKSGGIPSVPVPVTILMAFNAEPQTPSFVVGPISDNTTFIQGDFARSTNLQTPENSATMSLSINGAGGYTYDSATGVVSFPNLMSGPNGVVSNCLSLSQPIIVHTQGTPDTLVYPDKIGGAVWNPLQWYYVLDASYPSGGAPVVTGNSVIMASDSFLPGILNNGALTISGVLYAVNAQIPATQLHPLPAKPWLNQLWTMELANSPNIGDPNILWPQISSVTSTTDYLVKLNQTILGNNPNVPSSAYGVVAGDNALVSWGANGLYTFAKSNFLICDSGRVVEMDPSGNPIWSSDASASPGQSAINGAANIKPLSRPSRAYLLTDTSILVADPGANRVAMLNTTGFESRSITGFQLDPNVTATGYAPGESLNLSGPRDVAYYTTYTTLGNVAGLVSIGDGETASSVEYWQHYLIADTGNRRLVEIIDRFYFNPSTGLVGQPVTVGGVPQVGTLLWHSPAAESGKQYSYNSISRVKVPDANNGHYVYVTGIGGTLPTAVGTGIDVATPTSIVDAQDGSGGIVVYDPVNPAGVVTINSISLPNVLNTNFWDPSTGQFDTNINQSTALGMQTYAQRAGGIHRLSNLNSVTAKVVSATPNGPYTIGNLQIAIMIADGTGVYEVIYNPDQPQSQTLTADWMMPNEAFRVIQQTTVNNLPVPTPQNAQDLRALYARRLDSGDVLIVNGYYGYALSGLPFTGEVMQVNGATDGSVFNINKTNLGFNSGTITLDLRTAGSSGLRSLVMPVFADRR